MTAAPVLEEIAVTFSQYRKFIVAVLGIVGAVIQAMYPAAVPHWAVIATAAAAAALVYLVPNAPTSTSTRATSSAAAAPTSTSSPSSPSELSPFSAAAAVVYPLGPVDTATEAHSATWGAGHSCDTSDPHPGPCKCLCGISAPTSTSSAAAAPTSTSSPSGLDRAQEAIKQSRGGDPPTTVTGFA